ncbi:carbon-nitrogen hydrolase family protein [Nocardioides sp. GY 10113]|uniref:carbon-nitrogen hydrolase family protein n=1 Tax=Nocardioides sp. GY 10113 TaxID=2569761 RepID=UPI0010A75A7E|nr:carbon-nitrogen hydrolase family protein [Nocardioides sp. GY 10113]TIC88015.1 carbon-nitrogen hydrolase family protein [Nocardioides sp. GY 10113]
MEAFRIAAVQASYVLMDSDATIDRVAELTAGAAAQGAQLVVFPEVFVPGTPFWIDTRPIWDGDDEWFAMLVANAVTIPGPAADRLAAIAERHGVWLVVGVQEREPHGSTIYNTVLYLSPDGRLVDRHRKLVPTGSERTVWGRGDGSTLRVVDTPHGRIGGLICWENYMPLARFHLYAQGVDVWLAPTLAQGDGWVATMQHLARENRMYVVGVNPVLHADQVRPDFPDRDRLLPAAYLEEHGPWVEPGNTVIVAPSGAVLAGPLREAEGTLLADVDLAQVAAARRMMDPTGHYHRPDIFRLSVDTGRREATTEISGGATVGAWPNSTT